MQASSLNDLASSSHLPPIIPSWCPVALQVLKEYLRAYLARVDLLAGEGILVGPHIAGIIVIRLV